MLRKDPRLLDAQQSRSIAGERIPERLDLVEAGSLQPQFLPLRERKMFVSVVLLHHSDQIVEGGVLPGVLLEEGCVGCCEAFLSHNEHQLAENGSSFTVSDAVEN